MVVTKTRIELETELFTHLAIGHECHKVPTQIPYEMTGPENDEQSRFLVNQLKAKGNQDKRSGWTEADEVEVVGPHQNVPLLLQPVLHLEQSDS